MQRMTFADFDIYHRMTTLRKVHSITLTYFFNVKKFETLGSLKQWASAKMHGTTFIDFSSDGYERILKFEFFVR